MSSSRNSTGDSLCIKSRRQKKTLDLLEDPDDANDDESGEPEDMIAKAEALARENQKKFGGKRGSKMIGSKREYAQALHRQADIFHQKGDYETALVLYHRAASAYPRESSHGVAARRTAAAISSATNPSKALRKLLPKAKNSAQLVANFCPETAAKRAQKIVEESADPVSAIDQILKYFDSRKDFWRDPPIFRNRRRSTLISRSKIMLRQLGNLASIALDNLQAAFAADDTKTSLRIGNELLVIAEPLADCCRYEVAARHYLAMTHVTLGRHDRAVDQATMMIKSAKQSADLTLRSRSLMTLGRVHLTFRHLDAAARAWERLVKDVEDAVPRAWLLHEIGRCYFEMKRYGKALETSKRCLDYAEEGNSQKWLMHGTLLSGQSLLELGRLGEAVIALETARKIATDEQNQEIHKYISDLIDRLMVTLRQPVSCTDQIFDVNDTDQMTVERKARFAKSEAGLKFRKPREMRIPTEMHENILGDSMEKLKISKSSGKKMIAKDTRRKNLETRRINIEKTRALSRSPIRESRVFDDAILENDTDSSEISNVVQDDPLTSRTCVIKKCDCEDENLIDECCDVNKIVLDEEKRSGDETSNRTGETYVIDELLKFTRNKDESWETVNDENDDIRSSRSSLESGKSDKIVIRHVSDESNNVEYSRNDKVDNSEISLLRANSQDEEIDEDEDEEEDVEEEEEEEDDEEAQFLSPNHHEISSECESKISIATTGKTYLVDKNKNHGETTRINDKGEEIMRTNNFSTNYYYNPVDDFDSHREIDTKNIEDYVEKIADTKISSEMIFTKMENPKNVINLTMRELREENEKKFDISSSPRRSSFIDEDNGKNVSREICDVVSSSSYLSTCESISVTLSHHVTTNVPSSSQYRNSLPTSPRKEYQSGSLYSHVLSNSDSS